jgi:hypothetical protein
MLMEDLSGASTCGCSIAGELLELLVLSFYVGLMA